MRPYSLPFGGWVYRRGGAGSLEVSRFSLFYTHKLRFCTRFQGVSLRSKLVKLAGPYITRRKQSARQQCQPFSFSCLLLSCLVLFFSRAPSRVLLSSLLLSSLLVFLVPSSSLLPVFLRLVFSCVPSVCLLSSFLVASCVLLCCCLVCLPVASLRLVLRSCLGVLLVFCLSMLRACVVLIACAACVRGVLLLCFRLLPFTPYFVNSEITILMCLVCICKEIRKSEGKSVKKWVHFIAQLNILLYLCSVKNKQ